MPKMADTAAVEASVYVGPEARVLETAEVVENARIEGRATVSGGARVGGLAAARRVPAVIRRALLAAAVGHARGRRAHRAQPRLPLRIRRMIRCR